MSVTIRAYDVEFRLNHGGYQRRMYRTRKEVDEYIDHLRRVGALAGEPIIIPMVSKEDYDNLESVLEDERSAGDWIREQDLIPDDAYDG